MNNKTFIKVSVFALCLYSHGLFAQKGYPERSNVRDLYGKFCNPPQGYGEVPFYWWQADTLTKERLTWQLDQLAKKKITSLQVNYSHTDDKKGYFWGSSLKSQPAQFTDEWWSLFGWFMDEANKRNMTVSVSDYTLGLGQGYALDEVRALHPDIMASALVFERKDIAGGKLEMAIKPNLVSVVAFSKRTPGKFVDLTSKVDGGRLIWTGDGDSWAVVATYSERQERTYNPMHPLAGKEYVRCFFQRFEDKFPGKTAGKLNFFFSDELNFNLKGVTWDERFADEFKKRKGYDIRPYVAALKMDIGRLTAKVRMDYNDVFTSLSEENFFIPVYNWHAERNLIYGCDHGGRGARVDEFGDYFRTQRWNQGPGSDQPRLGKSVVKAKVAASIAHMYERPRVWLEGFYSSGWGTSSPALTDAIFSNFAMGYNLLSLHGLYYATPGSMWEWAPPCNHFRMPYWQTMDKTLEATERLSYLFSQGYHRCDIAVLYPVEPVVAGYKNVAASTAFKAAEILYGNGVDFDFVDYSSLQRATIENGLMKISGETYRAVVVPSMEAMKDLSLRKLGELSQSGVMVINIGQLPVATDAKGKDSAYVTPLVKRMTSGKGYSSVSKPEDLLSVLDKSFVRDFRIMDVEAGDKPYVNHRVVDSREIYGVYNVKKGTKCFFRSHGDVELWDVFSGKRYRLSDVTSTSDGTIVDMPLGKSAFQIIVFTPNSDAPTWVVPRNVRAIDLADRWDCEMVPVLDNTFGDFHYPGTPEKLRPEIRHYRYAVDASGKMKFDDIVERASSWPEVTYTYGAEFLCSGATDKVFDDAWLASLKSAPEDWKPYVFSRRWGVYGDAGHQGYHGLKMNMNPEVIRLGAFKRESTTTNRVEEPAGKNYYMFTTVNAPYAGDYDILAGADKPARWFVNGNRQTSFESVRLEKGVNTVVLCYDKPVVTYFFLRDRQCIKPDSAQRLTLQWYGDRSVLPFDPYGDKERYAWYYFESAPALEGFTVGVNGKADIWVDGRKVKSVTNGNMLDVTIKRPSPEPVGVAMRIELPYGVNGGAAITSELVQRTGKGRLSAGDWGQVSGLRNYSGGVKYSQRVNIAPEVQGKRVRLCVSDLSSAARLCVNGRYVDTRVCPDWEFDITDYVVAGDNLIELTVYNSAANHYETIPTQFRGNSPSGILGKARIEYFDM